MSERAAGSVARAVAAVDGLRKRLDKVWGEDRGWVTRFAAQADVSPPTLYRFRRGEDVSLMVALKIERALDGLPRSRARRAGAAPGCCEADARVG